MAEENVYTPSARAYQYSAVDMNQVYNCPEEFIIPENLAACKLLWSKNIFTIMCNNYENDESWITVSDLDETNQKLFAELCQSNPDNFGKTWGGVGIKVPVKPIKGADIFSTFKPLIELFSYQDVQKDGYMTKEEFLNYYCGCFKMVPNPEYEDIPEPEYEESTDKQEYIKKYAYYCDHHLIPKTVRAFDETKMEKSFQEYLSESLFANYYDEDNGRIYYNELYYQSHLNYIKQHKVPTF